MIERHHDYQLTVAEVPPGGVRNVPLQLDTDAPFALRLVRSRNLGMNLPPFAQEQRGFGWRFQTPKKVWQSNELRTDWVPRIEPTGVQPFPSRGATIYPELVYPVGSQIVVDIGNPWDEPLINARVLFRGSKLFRDGALLSPSYPAQFSALPFTYPTVLQNVGLAASATQPFIVRDAQLRVRQDSDFVLRYAVCDPFRLFADSDVVPPGYTSFAQPTFSEVYVTLRDESRKAYSNEPIHINDLFGVSFPSILATAGSVARTDDQGSGPWFPGLFTPEIYLERQCSLYFDVFRYDTTGFPVDLHFRFQGAKVFGRS